MVKGDCVACMQSCFVAIGCTVACSAVTNEADLILEFPWAVIGKLMHSKGKWKLMRVFKVIFLRTSSIGKLREFCEELSAVGCVTFYVCKYIVCHISLK